MEIKATGDKRPLIVYWDGKCPLCAKIKSWFVRFDSQHRLVFLDFRNPKDSLTASPRFSPKELADEMRVNMPDGSWRTGYFAWAEILTATPAFLRLGTVMKSWLFADVGPKAYRWIADNRFEISRILHLPKPCDSSGACEISVV